MMKLLSRGETKENNSFEAQNPEWDKENAFETEYVTEYEIDISTPKDSLAKTYEDKNEMIVILQVPKSDYKNENIQKLLKWGRAKVNKKDYYRDIAIYVNEAETYERTIVFTHAEVSVNEFSVIKEEIVTMTITINQKRDKFPGVAFGSQIDETYQKAWKKVLNPPRLNIYVPVATDENKEYAVPMNKDTVMIFRTEGRNSREYDAFMYLTPTEINGINRKVVSNVRSKVTNLINMGYSYKGKNNELDLNNLNFTSLVKASLNISLLGKNKKDYDIQVYEKVPTKIYVKKGSTLIGEDKGYFNMVNGSNFAANPVNLVSILSGGKQILKKGADSKYVLCDSKSGKEIFKMAMDVYADAILKNISIDIVPIRTLMTALEVVGTKYTINWDEIGRVIKLELLIGKTELYSSNEYLSLEQMQVNARYIFNSLSASDWSKNPICAILGNMQTESTMNPGIWQNFKKNNMDVGFGLVQWTPATKYFDWAKENGLDPYDIDTQLKRILYETNPLSDDKDAQQQWQAFRNDSEMTFEEFICSSKSPEELAKVFLYSYERPRDKPQPKRGEQARYWFDFLN